MPPLMPSCGVSAWVRHSCLWAALALLLFSAIGVFPGVALAGMFSDGLSAPYVHLLRTSQWVLSLALLAGGIAAQMFTKLAPRLCPLRFRGGRFSPALWIALLGFGGAWGIQGALFGHIPHITDATSHCFQAQVFAAGHLSAPAPPCPPAFFQHNVIISPSGLWHTKYFPGQALWLAGPWRSVAMPLAFFIFLLASHRIASRYFGAAVAHVATLLLSVSPLLLLLAASFMSHTTLLMWMALCWAFLLSALEATASGRIRFRAALSGFCVGMGALTRPQDAALFALFMLAAIWPLLRKNADKIGRTLLGGALGVLPPLAFLLLWNLESYGHWMASGYHLAGAPALSQTPIIQDTIGFSGGFTPVLALKQAFWSGLRLNQALLGWPLALPLLIPALGMASVRRGNAWLLAGAAALYLPYFFFHYYGFELEARYAATAAPLLVLIIARTLVAGWGLAATADGQRAMAAWIAAFSLYAAAYYWPIYLWPRYSGAYEEASNAIQRAAQKANMDLPALVLLPNENFIYSSGFIHDDPWLKNPILYARDLPSQMGCLREAFPTRHLYRYRPEAGNSHRGDFIPIPAEANIRP